MNAHIWDGLPQDHCLAMHAESFEIAPLTEQSGLSKTIAALQFAFWGPLARPSFTSVVPGCHPAPVLPDGASFYSKNAKYGKSEVATEPWLLCMGLFFDFCRS
ncbi:hypothetical protein [Bradyrhizobium sp. Ghvi]|uniref:hypothetical protein n=1 Tax=Bradyrhizobium sp. Ghvi TaxID=1855319 RepID=UPI00117750DD|nr:hypothetical protein [Bradyrhizobium sp. Ghvi]